MKNKLFLALFTLIVSILPLRAGMDTTWQPKGSGVVFGIPGKEIWSVATNKEDPTEDKIKWTSKLEDLYLSEVHPFEWYKHIPLEIVWHIRSSQQNLNAELKKFDSSSRASWVWDSAPKKPFKIFVALPGNGFGRINVFQGDQIIASFACVSSNFVSKGSKIEEFSQPQPAAYKVLNKELSRTTGEGLPMKWAMLIDEKRGIYLHSRDIGENSHACIGISVPAIEWLYPRVSDGKNGTIVSISHVK